MSYQEDMRAKLLAIAGDLARAVKRGENALSFSDKSNAAILQAYHDLDQTRLQVVAAIDHLDTVVIPRLQALVNESMSMHVDDAYNETRESRRLLSQYATHLANRIEELKKTSNLIAHWSDTELLGAGNRIADAAQSLQHYNEIL